MTSTSRTVLTFTAAFTALALGCQTPDEDGADALAQDGIASDPSFDGGIVAPTVDAGADVDAGNHDAGKRDAGPPNPNGPFFAEVTANGTGCPAGSWASDISKDGATFTLTFDRYEAEIADDQRVSFKDCNVTIKLHSPVGLSYAVSEFYYEGYAYLESGVKAFQTANYYFQGNPVPAAANEKRTDLTGPIDRSYLFQDAVRARDAVVWSPCGLDRNLQIVTRLGLQKSQAKGAGFISVQELRAPKLIWKRC